jgi:hypothetical protein
MYALQYTRAWHDTLKQRNDWVQIVVYTLIAVSVVSSLAIAAYCTARGGSMEWSYRFGIFVKVACRFNR